MDHQDLSFPDPDDGLSATPLKSILPHPQQHDSASQAIIMGKENTGKSKNSETNDRPEKRCELLEITLCKTYVPKKKQYFPARERDHASVLSSHTTILMTLRVKFVILKSDRDGRGCPKAGCGSRLIWDCTCPSRSYRETQVSTLLIPPINENIVGIQAVQTKSDGMPKLLRSKIQIVMVMIMMMGVVPRLPSLSR